MKRVSIVLAALLAVAFAGCQTSAPNVLSVPVAREYQNLEQVRPAVAREKVDEARRLGAAAYAPYEFASAEYYLNIAEAAKSRHNRKGAWDYAALSIDMAEAAMRTIPEERRRANVASPQTDEESCLAEFERVKARYLEINDERAIASLPTLYAQATSALSLAEHNVSSGKRWRETAWAASRFQTVCSAIWKCSFSRSRVNTRLVTWSPTSSRMRCSSPCAGVVVAETTRSPPDETAS